MQIRKNDERFIRCILIKTDKTNYLAPIPTNSIYRSSIKLRFELNNFKQQNLHMYDF